MGVRVFVKIDLAENKRRWYVVSWGPTLFETWAVVCTWGRLGTDWSQRQVQEFETQEEAMGEATPEHPRIGFYDGSYTVLQLKSPDVMGRMLPGRDLAWRMLDVSVLHEVLIERVMDISAEAVERKENIEYLRDAQMGYDAVDKGEAEFLLVMNPTRMEQVRACTAAGEKMPQKSTDFYPKVISGLVMMPIGVEERSDSQFAIFFKDEGIGMSEDEKEACFQPFRGEFPQGTGLGLSIVYRVVQEHSGRIQIQSEKGQGTRVEVLLPVEKESLAVARA